MFRTILGTLLLAALAAAQQTTPELTDQQILDLYRGLRVADVVDGMDIAGLRNVGLMSTNIQPLWRDLDEFDHIIHGIALTVRYVPHNRVLPNVMPEKEFHDWEGDWYENISPEPFVPMIKRGHVIVIDASGSGDTGSIGSYNSLDWYTHGAVGIVTSGSVRDTDEIIKEQIPLYMDPLQRGRGIRPGRNMIESVNKPVVVGGALVRPGDLIVADGDGVVVVPREHVAPVAKAARAILDEDKDARRELYEKSGRPLDRTVKH